MDRKEYLRKWRQDNKDYILEQARVYRNKNKKIILKKRKEAYYANREFFIKIQKKYYKANRESIIKKNSEYANRPENRENIRKIHRKSSKKFINNNPWITSFYNAKNRCTNKNAKDYKSYGAKGIKFLMSKQDFSSIWKRDRASLMKKPSIDRINPLGNYEHKNCRFIEFIENRRRRDV